MSAPHRLLSLACVAACLVGCTTIRGEVAMPLGDDMPDLAWEPQQGQSGGVFVPGSVRALTSDSRAYRAGDVLTVVLQESTQASNRNNSAISKESSLSMAPGRLLGSDVDLDTELGLTRGATGAGSSSQQNMLVGSVTVIVQRVLPNGLLQVGGEKSLGLNQSVETVRLNGYVRPADIGSDNRVSSQRVANARIQYSGRGPVASANRAGWLTRFFNSPLMPF